MPHGCAVGLQSGIESGPDRAVHTATRESTPAALKPKAGIRTDAKATRLLPVSARIRLERGRCMRAEERPFF